MTRGFRDEDEQRPQSSPPVAFEGVRALRASKLALLCEFQVTVKGKPESKRDWVPQSQIHGDSEVFEAGHEGKLVITGWYADKLEGVGIVP